MLIQGSGQSTLTLLYSELARRDTTCFSSAVRHPCQALVALICSLPSVDFYHRSTILAITEVILRASDLSTGLPSMFSHGEAADQDGLR